jgi:hypothetical protein
MYLQKNLMSIACQASIKCCMTLMLLAQKIKVLLALFTIEPSIILQIS